MYGCLESQNLRPDKSIESFINDLYSITEHLNYDDLKDKLIRDKLVISIKDKKLFRRLQLLANLTLKTAVEQCNAVNQHKLFDSKRSCKMF